MQTQPRFIVSYLSVVSHRWEFLTPLVESLDDAETIIRAQRIRGSEAKYHIFELVPAKEVAA